MKISRDRWDASDEIGGDRGKSHMSKKWAEAWASVMALRPLLRAVLDLAVAAQSSQLNLCIERQVVGVMGARKGHGVEHACTGAAPPMG